MGPGMLNMGQLSEDEVRLIMAERERMAPYLRQQQEDAARRAQYMNSARIGGARLWDLLKGNRPTRQPHAEWMRSYEERLRREKAYEDAIKSNETKASATARRG